MKSSTFTYKDEDKINIFVYKWIPDSIKPKAAIQICHGLVEHAGRYERVAERLTSAGFVCYADDHRGHGITGDNENKGYLGENGWEKVVRDLKQLNDIIIKEYPEIPCFLIGHSWGSFLFQDFVQQYGENLKGLILSGSNGHSDQERTDEFMQFLIEEIEKYGPKKFNEEVAEKLFGAFNEPFDPNKTGSGFEWLSRDKAEVDKYVNDRLCGYAGTTNLYMQLFYGTGKIWKEENERRISKELPIYIMSGSEDPVGNNGKNLHLLVARYKRYGIKDVSLKLYEGARHEIFNETNREEVFQDLIKWLDSHL